MTSTPDPERERTGGTTDTTQDYTGAAKSSGDAAFDSEEQQRREWAKRVVDALPPLSEEQRERLALLLRTHG